MAVAKVKVPTQRQQIVDYMKKNGSITRLDSGCKLFIFELSSRIGELEAHGWLFKKDRETRKNSYGQTKRFTRYSILREGEEI